MREASRWFASICAAFDRLAGESIKTSFTIQAKRFKSTGVIVKY